MKTKYCILLISLFLSVFSFSQERNFFDYYHWNPELFKANKIYKCHIINKRYKLGKLDSEHLEIIETYDTLGRITTETEYFEADTTFGWYINYKYDSLSRIIETEYFWNDEKNWDKTNYSYNSKGKLSNYCEYNKPNKKSSYSLNNCFKIHWVKNKVGCVTNSNNDTTAYFKHKGKKAYRYTMQNSIDTEYVNGFMVMRKYPDNTYHYARNKQGQIVKTTAFNNEDIKIGETIFEYKKGLLMTVTGYDQNSTITYQEVYNYFYR